MSKSVDWESTYKPFGFQRNGPQPKYRSGKEYFQKAQEDQAQQEEMARNFQKSLPALEALLKCKLEDRSPLSVVRPIGYVTSDLVHVREQVEDRVNGGWKDGDVKYSQFQDVRKSVRPGTTLVLKSLDPHLQEFIFLDQDGKEVVLPYSAKMELMTKTNIYESVMAFMKKRGE